ncbi:hypothetical protein [Nocardia sp. NPDC005745]
MSGIDAASTTPPAEELEADGLGRCDAGVACAAALASRIPAAVGP